MYAGLFVSRTQMVIDGTDADVEPVRYLHIAVAGNGGGFYGVEEAVAAVTILGS